MWGQEDGAYGQVDESPGPDGKPLEEGSICGALTDMEDLQEWSTNGHRAVLFLVAHLHMTL